MTVLDDLASGMTWPLMRDTHGVIASYEAPEANPASLTVVPKPEEDPEQEYTEAGIRMVRRRVFYCTRDATATEGGISQPSKRAALVVDGERWSIMSAAKFPGALWQLSCRYDSAVEVTREGYRRP